MDGAGCCYGNPSLTYSVRWDTKCEEYEDTEWCLTWVDADGFARCEWQELGEFVDYGQVWPTETTTQDPPSTELFDFECRSSS